MKRDPPVQVFMVDATQVLAGARHYVLLPVIVGFIGNYVIEPTNKPYKRNVSSYWPYIFLGEVSKIMFLDVIGNEGRKLHLKYTSFVCTIFDYWFYTHRRVFHLICTFLHITFNVCVQICGAFFF
jgi:hypothetical protein